MAYFRALVCYHLPEEGPLQGNGGPWAKYDKIKKRLKILNLNYLGEDLFLKTQYLSFRPEV